MSIFDRLAIAISKENHYYCNSNDRLIRKVCCEYDIKFTGTLGVLGRAFKKGLLTDEKLKEVINKIKGEETTIYIKQNIIDDFINSL